MARRFPKRQCFMGGCRRAMRFGVIYRWLLSRGIWMLSLFSAVVWRQRSHRLAPLWPRNKSACCGNCMTSRFYVLTATRLASGPNYARWNVFCRCLSPAGRHGWQCCQLAKTRMTCWARLVPRVCVKFLAQRGRLLTACGRLWRNNLMCSNQRRERSSGSLCANLYAVLVIIRCGGLMAMRWKTESQRCGRIHGANQPLLWRGAQPDRKPGWCSGIALFWHWFWRTRRWFLRILRLCRCWKRRISRSINWKKQWLMPLYVIQILTRRP